VQGHGSGDVARRVAEARAARILHPGLSFRQSWGYLSTFRDEQETYRRFLGTIYFRGHGRALVARIQRLATEQIPKIGENSKTNVIFPGADPRFCAKTGRKSTHFYCQTLAWVLPKSAPAVVVEELAPIFAGRDFDRISGDLPFLPKRPGKPGIRNSPMRGRPGNPHGPENRTMR
jgi:hypothetical protein